MIILDIYILHMQVKTAFLIMRYFGMVGGNGGYHKDNSGATSDDKVGIMTNLCSNPKLHDYWNKWLRYV